MHLHYSLQGIIIGTANVYGKKFTMALMQSDSLTQLCYVRILFIQFDKMNYYISSEYQPIGML